MKRQNDKSTNIGMSKRADSCFEGSKATASVHWLKLQK